MATMHSDMREQTQIFRVFDFIRSGALSQLTAEITLGFEPHPYICVAFSLVKENIYI
jgi:hypothetical protein